MTAIEIFNNGLAKARIKDYEGALLDFDIAIGLEPNSNANFYNNKGVVLGKVGRKNEAIEFFKKAIEMDNKNSHFYFNRAESYGYFRKYKLAIKDYKKALQINPNDTEALSQMKLAEYYHQLERKNKKSKTDPNKKITLFLSYSHKDEQLKAELDSHLSTLKRMGFIDVWNDRKINPGDDWENEIDENLENSNIIVCLISSDFVNSDYCYSKELERALEKHNNKEAIVVPIVIRPVVWNILPIGKIQGLPKDGKAVTSWNNKDEAFEDVVKGLLKVVNEIRKTDT